MPLQIPYALDDTIFPTPSDDDLWQSCYQTLLADYGPERVLLEHARWAFESVCEELGDALPFGAFLRKVRLRWLWKRPPLPRGVVGL